MLTGNTVFRQFPATSKHHILCNRKLFLGPDLGTYFAALAMIVIPTILFIAFPARDLIYSFSPAVMAVTIILFILSISFITIANATDPGIIPRDPAGISAVLLNGTTTTNATTNTTNTNKDNELVIPQVKDFPPSREIIVNSVPVILKYCNTCKLYRPPRSSHCSSCDCCIENFDHHCPWTGNCVGRRNYRYFVSFLISTSLLIFVIFTFSIVNLSLVIIDASKNHNSTQFTSGIERTPVSILLIVFSLFVVCQVPGLCCFHLNLIFWGQTTNEQIKGVYYGKSKRKTNDYSQGKVRNCLHVCDDQGPSHMISNSEITPV